MAARVQRALPAGVPVALGGEVRLDLGEVREELPALFGAAGGERDSAADAQVEPVQVGVQAGYKRVEAEAELFGGWGRARFGEGEELDQVGELRRCQCVL